MKKTGKVLIMIRTSTEKQDIDNQHNEMVEFCKQRGYLEENMVFIQEQGASAVKMDDRYKAQIEEIKEAIRQDENIDCFACWHLNRAFRNEEAYLDIKSFLLPRKIQMLVKNPSLELLNADGTINKGMELAMGLFAILNKQEDEERKEKFKRTKKANALKGKYNGGCNIRYGYKVDDNQYYVIDEVEGKIVSTIFELYSTGKYSGKTLALELHKRGINMQHQKIINILHSDAYCGRPQEKWYDRVYPAIISEELFDKCQSIRGENKIMTRRGDKQTIGSKIIKCPECGCVYTGNSTNYSCCGHSVLRKCSNSLTIKKSVIDGLLWRVASTLHLQYLLDDNDSKVEEYKKEIEIYDTKIDVLQGKIDSVDEKKARVIDLYIEGLIDSKNKANRLLKIQNDIQVWVDELNALKEAKNRLYSLIENIGKGDEVEMLMSALDEVEENEKSLEYKYDIVHKYITSAICKREWFGESKRRARLTKENGVRIEINTIFNTDPWIFMYVPNGYDGCKLWVWNGREYLKDKEG